jgi:DNA end-binding protein Ku
VPRSIWTGAISFGLVNVPVKLYSAVSSKSVRFHQLHAEDGGRVRQKRVCTVDGEEVSFEEIVKGYELGPDRYVVITPDELEGLDPKASRTIDIEDFVALDDIDPIFFDHPYYLAPATGAAKSYRLLLDAMRESGRAGIARVVMRQKQYLCALRATDDGVIAMSTMNYGDEVVSPETIDELDAAEETETTDRELTMARQLIDSLSSEWDPDKYHDTYRERVLELIERKAAGEEIAVQPAEEPAPVPDLMAALEASLAAVKSDGGDSKAKPSRPKKSAASKNGSAKKNSRSKSRS